jgi:hypothetical protein
LPRGGRAGAFSGFKVPRGELETLAAPILLLRNLSFTVRLSGHESDAIHFREEIVILIGAVVFTVGAMIFEH